jgi:guanine nucleotide-binding protein G(i) subunit alpha
MGANLGRLSNDHARSIKDYEPPEDLKILLLGAGDTGKSTFFKQIKIMFQSGYSREECEQYREIIWGVCLKAMKALVAASLAFDIPIIEPENRERAERINDMDVEVLINISKVWNEQLAVDIAKLWKDVGMQRTYQQRHRFQLDETCPYFFESLERIGKWDYVPTEEDVLRSRVKTTGIVETEFKLGNKEIKVVDTGGQRNERKKWIHTFEGVTTIMFFVNLAEYPLLCYEDDETNRMRESLLLFDEIINSRWFVDTPIILVLNKVDLFRELIKTSSLKAAFPEYTGGPDFDVAIDFIRRKFEDKNHREDRTIYTVLTDSSNTSAVSETFKNLSGIILRKPNYKFKFLSWLVSTKVHPNIYKKVKFADVSFFFYGDIALDPILIPRREEIDTTLSSPSQIVQMMTKTAVPRPLRKNLSQKILKKVESLRMVKGKFKTWDSLKGFHERAQSWAAMTTYSKVSSPTSNLCSNRVSNSYREMSPITSPRLNLENLLYMGSLLTNSNTTKQICGDSSDDSSTSSILEEEEEEEEEQYTPRTSRTDKPEIRDYLISIMYGDPSAEEDESSEAPLVIEIAQNRRRAELVNRERSPLGKTRAITPPTPIDQSFVDHYNETRKMYLDVEAVSVVAAKDTQQKKSFREKLAMFKELEKVKLNEKEH